MVTNAREVARQRHIRVKPKPTKSRTIGTQETVRERKSDFLVVCRLIITPVHSLLHLAHNPTSNNVRTQCHKDAGHELKSNEHQEPPHSPQDPCENCVSRMLSIKDFLKQENSNVPFIIEVQKRKPCKKWAPLLHKKAYVNKINAACCIVRGCYKWDVCK